MDFNMCVSGWIVLLIVNDNIHIGWLNFKTRNGKIFVSLNYLQLVTVIIKFLDNKLSRRTRNKKMFTSSELSRKIPKDRNFRH